MQLGPVYVGINVEHCALIVENLPDLNAARAPKALNIPGYSPAPPKVAGRRF